MLARIILAYVLALPVLVGFTESGSGGHTIDVTMASTVPGYLQVFFDTGQGFSQSQSVVVPVFASEDPREYSAPIPPGQYRQLRIDPCTIPGRYVIRSAAIVRADRTTETVLPLSSLAAVYELTTIERTDSRLVVEAPPGGDDPQLLYAPAQPLKVPVEEGLSSGTLWRLPLAWAAAILAVWIVERASRGAGERAGWALRRLRHLGRARPRSAVLASAALATVLATYPIVFLGRSVVSPNNGGLRMLYDWLPSVPGSRDSEVEDTRLSDVGAALWAFVPYSNVQREALRVGEWPLWNRYNAAGRPLWGQGQTFLLDPLHWPTIITPDPALGWDLKFIAHRFVFAGGVGVAALIATGAWFPAALVAFAAPFVGVYAYRLNHPAVFAMTYAPWVLVAWFLLARAGSGVERARAALLMACATALLLFASPPKEAIATMLAMCAAGAVTVIASPVGWGARLQGLMAAVLAGAAVALLTAPDWLIFLDTWRVSFTAYDVPWAQVGGVREAVALFLSPLAPGPVLPGLHMLALVLVVAALSAPDRLRRNPAALGCALSAAVCLSIAFGIVPVRWLLVTPFIANIGHLHDVFITAAVPVLLVVAATGASVLRAAGRVRVLSVTVLVLATSWWLVSHVARLAPANGFEPWAAGFVAILAAMLPAALARIGPTTVLPTAAAVAVIVVLVLPGGLHAQTGSAPLDALLLQPRLRVALDKNSPAVDSMHRAATEPGRAFGTDWTLIAGSQALYEVEGLGGPDALAIAKYDELVNAAGIARAGWLTKVGFNEVPSLAPLLDMLNATYTFTAIDRMPPGVDELPVTGQDRLKLGRRNTAWPRAFFVDGVWQYSDPAELLRRAAAVGRPFAAIQQGDGRALDATRELTTASGEVIPARGYRLSPNTTSFRINSKGPGVVALEETFLPDDFVATLNGRRVPYFRVNHAFKGVVIPAAGEWRVTFEYRPTHWRVSLALAGVGFIALAGAGFAARPPRRHRGVSTPGAVQSISA